MFKLRTNLYVGISHRVLLHWLIHQIESIWPEIHGQHLKIFFTMHSKKSPLEIRLPQNCVYFVGVV